MFEEVADAMNAAESVKGRKLTLKKAGPAAASFLVSRMLGSRK
jgi:hypothetical protein